jgi:hypothetical protein
VWGERGAEERQWEACAAKERRREASTKVFLLSDGADIVFLAIRAQTAKAGEAWRRAG